MPRRCFFEKEWWEAEGCFSLICLKRLVSFLIVSSTLFVCKQCIPEDRWQTTPYRSEHLAWNHADQQCVQPPCACLCFANQHRFSSPLWWVKARSSAIWYFLVLASLPLWMFESQTKATLSLSFCACDPGKNIFAPGYITAFPKNKPLLLTCSPSQ